METLVHIRMGFKCSTSCGFSRCDEPHTNWLPWVWLMLCPGVVSWLNSLFVSRVEAVTRNESLMDVVQELISYIIIVIFLSDLCPVYDACPPNLPQHKDSALLLAGVIAKATREALFVPRDLFFFFIWLLQRRELAFNLESLSLGSWTFWEIAAERNNLIRVDCAQHYPLVVRVWLRTGVTVSTWTLSTVRKMEAGACCFKVARLALNLNGLLTRPLLFIYSVLFVSDLLTQWKWPVDRKAMNKGTLHCFHNPSAVESSLLPVAPILREQAVTKVVVEQRLMATLAELWIYSSLFISIFFYIFFCACSSVGSAYQFYVDREVTYRLAKTCLVGFTVRAIFNYSLHWNIMIPYLAVWAVPESSRVWSIFVWDCPASNPHAN